MTYAGDLGGLFGLFLGGSAISIFEIIDLFLYNAIIKLFSSSKVLPSGLKPTQPPSRLSHQHQVKESHIIHVECVKLDDSFIQQDEAAGKDKKHY